MPSEPTQRQHAEAFLAPVSWATVEFLKNAKVLFSPLKSGHVPLDIDVFTMDNSATRKREYPAPTLGLMATPRLPAYLANEGWLIHWQLRPGSQHSQKEYIPFLQTTLARVRQINSGKLLVRKDSAHGALDTRIDSPVMSRLTISSLGIPARPTKPGQAGLCQGDHHLTS